MSDDLALSRLKGAHIGYFGKSRGLYWDKSALGRAKRSRSGHVVVGTISADLGKLEGTFSDIQADSFARPPVSHVIETYVVLVEAALDHLWSAKLVRAELGVESRSPRHRNWIVPEAARVRVEAHGHSVARVEPITLPVPQPPSDFMPSASLVAFWRRGLEAHRAEARRNARFNHPREVWEGQTTDELARVFSIKLRRMFSIIGNRERHGIENYKAVGSAGRFALGVQYQILDRIQISARREHGVLLAALQRVSSVSFLWWKARRKLG